MERIQLFTKLQYLPADVKLEVNDFIDFLMNKRKKEKKQKTPKFGCAKGQIYISDDFDEPFQDFEE